MHTKNKNKSLKTIRDLNAVRINRDVKDWKTPAGTSIQEFPRELLDTYQTMLLTVPSEC